LAGSAARGETAREDARLAQQLLRSEKDLWEQNLVLKTIVENLESLGLKPAYPDTVRLVQLANVQHLCTPITAELSSDLHLLDVVSKLHPTPAVGGMPRQEALKIIQQLEPNPRGLYAGPLGWFNDRGEGEAIVALRCAWIHGNCARLYAGSGIVAGSEPLLERQETQIKWEALRPILQ
ncbi:MAG TPA: chorismate-binding protein, partial [Opitutales bacterium]|nr:chorismate-binding protein [Opitutales bacterium]